MRHKIRQTACLDGGLVDGEVSITPTHVDVASFPLWHCIYALHRPISANLTCTPVAGPAAWREQTRHMRTRHGSVRRRHGASDGAFGRCVPVVMRSRTEPAHAVSHSDLHPCIQRPTVAPTTRTVRTDLTHTNTPRVSMKVLWGERWRVMTARTRSYAYAKRATVCHEP